MQGRKTHEQFTRILEHKPDIDGPVKQGKRIRAKYGNKRQTEFPVSRQGMHQESEHNKHNNPEQGATKH